VISLFVNTLFIFISVGVQPLFTGHLNVPALLEKFIALYIEHGEFLALGNPVRDVVWDETGN